MREKKREGRTRAAAASFIVVLCALAWVGWVGCLPDLAPIPPEEAGAIDEGGSVPQNACGDGIIATLDDGGDAGESCDPADATVKGCRNCEVECTEDGGVLDSAGRCYFALGKFTTFGAARTACRNENAHLVTLSTPEEVTFVSSVAGGQPYWVGLIFNNETPGFKSAADPEPGFARAPSSGPCEGCFAVGTDGGEIPPEPDGGGVDCVIARSTSSWTAVDCLDAKGAFTALCEREPEGLRTTNCIGGFCINIPKTAGKKTYLLGVGSLSASEADATCKSLEGRLAVFETVEEREQIAREIALRYPTDQETTYWIGLSNGGAAWAWDDGVAADASVRRSQWGDKQPFVFDAGVPARAFLRIATIYDVALAYADDDAKVLRRYICERKPSP